MKDLRRTMWKIIILLDLRDQRKKYMKTLLKIAKLEKKKKEN